MKHQATTYKQGGVKKLLASVYAAIIGKPVTHNEGDPPVHVDVKFARALFKAKKPKPVLKSRKMSARPIAIGTYGVSSLKDIQELMEKHQTHQSRLGVTHLNSRQAVQQATKDCAERVTRDIFSDGTRASRQIQTIISQIVAQPEPLVTLGRFLLHLHPLEDRRLLAPVISILLGIPLDQLVQTAVEKPHV